MTGRLRSRFRTICCSSSRLEGSPDPGSPERRACLRISVIQMSPGSDKRENIAQARQLIGAVLEVDRPDLVVLPEMWTCLGGDRETKFAQAETLPAADGSGAAGEAYTVMQGIARKAGGHLHGHPVLMNGGVRLLH